MKIVNRKEFFALPQGTVFMKYEPCNFGPLSIKTQTWDTDWLDIDLCTFHGDTPCSGTWAELLFKMQETGVSAPSTRFTTTRDGLFDQDQLFAILEKGDHYALIQQLADAFVSAFKDDAKIKEG